MSKILFIGESWMVHVQETKGYDVFTYDYYETATEYIQKALTEGTKHEFKHLPSHLVESEFPKTKEELAEYDVVMISDCGANTFNLPMSTFIQLKQNQNKLQMLQEYVRAGGALVMIGGYLTFQGIEAKGAYKNTYVEETLPISLLHGDDRMERCQGVYPKVELPDHPVLKGVPKENWPCVLGYNYLIAKENTDTIVSVEGNPMIVLGTYGKGRTCAYATDCAPHWSPIEFCTWEGYKPLWNNLVEWLTNK